MPGSTTTLIGNAGEYFVMAELLRRGVVAALAPRNAPAFDILAAYGGRTVRIRVKTRSAQYNDWQWNAKKDGETIFLELGQSRDDFTILVTLADEGERPKYYVLPTATLDCWLKRRWKEWLETPGVRGRPHDPDNKGRHLSFKQAADGLAEYEDAWDRLWED